MASKATSSTHPTAGNHSGDTQRVRLCLSYDGTDFYGWQKQKNQKATIQGLLEDSLSKIINSPTRVVGSGRTDRGVHALGQWAHFDGPKGTIPQNLLYRLQRMTPEAIQIKRVELAPDDFHAQISAERKTYLYRMRPKTLASPFLRDFCWFCGDFKKIHTFQSLTDEIVGIFDFSSFQSTGTEVSSTVRQVFSAQWSLSPSGFIDLRIQGSGFLKQMVRNIVGTVVELSENGAKPEDFRKILLAKDRQRAGAPAPAQGLYLDRVDYPRELDNKCRKL